MIPHFRAYDREDKVIREVAGIHWGIGLIEFCDEEIDECTYDLDKYDVMEYTTLHDKHNTEICEGDIVVKFEVNSVVVRNLGAFGYMAYEGFIGFACNQNLEWIGGISKKIEIIGNIHKTPELIPDPYPPNILSE